MVNNEKANLTCPNTRRTVELLRSSPEPRRKYFYGRPAVYRHPLLYLPTNSFMEEAAPHLGNVYTITDKPILEEYC